MYAQIQRYVMDAYRQSPLWTFSLPGDAAAGLASTAWTPVAAEIARQTGAGSAADAKKAVYAQIVAMLTRTAEEAAVPIRSPHFSAADRLAFGGLVLVLLNNYRPLLAG